MARSVVGNVDVFLKSTGKQHQLTRRAVRLTVRPTDQLRCIYTVQLHAGTDGRTRDRYINSVSPDPFIHRGIWQVYVQLLTYADKVQLPVFARRMPLYCSNLLPAGPTAANPFWYDRQTDKWTDGQTERQTDRHRTVA